MIYKNLYTDNKIFFIKDAFENIEVNNIFLKLNKQKKIISLNNSTYICETIEKRIYCIYTDWDVKNKTYSKLFYYPANFECIFEYIQKLSIEQLNQDRIKYLEKI